MRATAITAKMHLAFNIDGLHHLWLEDCKILIVIFRYVLTTFCRLLGLLSIKFFLSTRSAALSSHAAVTPMGALYHQQKLNVSTAPPAFGLLRLVSTTAVFTTLSVASSVTCKLSEPPATCLPTPKLLSYIGI